MIGIMGNTANKAFSLTTITFLAIIAITSGQEYQYKCVVENNETICDANHQEFNIKAEFDRLSETLEESQKVMQLLEIYNSSIDEIPENAFSDIAFNSIKIFGAQDLTQINSKAFGDKAITYMNNQLLIDNPSNLSNSPPDYDFYKALNSLTNIVYIQIGLKELTTHEIPDNAFNESQNNLQYLVFDSRIRDFDSGYGISRIGSHSFIGLSSLIALSFRRLLIQNISQNAFNFNTESNERLTINLEDCLIFDETLENDMFTGARRPLTVNLGLNVLSYIREETFAKFLKENNQNILQLYGNYLNCDDIKPFLWILKNKTEYQAQISGAKCSDQTSIWDLIIDDNPGQEYQYKCVVENNETLCDANHQEFDIKAEFDRLSETLEESQKVMQLLEIHNSSIDEIPENAFSNITFRTVKIFGAQDLTRINSKAFGDKFIANMNNQLLIDNPSNLSNSPPDYDLYKALNSLTNIAYIQISLKELYYFHEIPDNAFNKPQNNLKYLVFDSKMNWNSGYGMSRIGSNSFVGLSNLSALSFRRITIKNISSTAFAFNSGSDERLTINFGDSLLFDESLENDVFSGAQRPLTINLGLNLLTHIKEETFSKFLNENNQNLLKVYGCPLNCDDINQFSWILNNRIKYKKQIVGAFCSNGTSIWELNINENNQSSTVGTALTEITTTNATITPSSPPGSSALMFCESNLIALSLILFNSIVAVL